ncbi:hypothetical protein J7E95_30975 [Streptomyces sp. ISL-14]|nr:hypothetical protein [Streptomyces sp. ISL-14]
MLACGCMDPYDIVVTWTGYGFVGVVGLLIGIVCLAGLMLGAMVAAGHLVRRLRGYDDADDVPGEDDGEETAGLAGFRWESEP